ncbi:hypothetical protein D3N24_21235 [Vibrio vulnificus]|nr:hypothetical protein FORC36_1546 [Vibrio vulnificus]EGR1869932.1 hypothetical protein [Vibrio vulnificus]POB23539.1 hypothetical protein CRN22_14635 [Vibrio vulnificus]POB71966.1 hypothetical protein CRN59_01115 [Vibrio vulnificus]HAS8133660.1 hypothetical protein [Vibrio vulnificus]
MYALICQFLWCFGCSGFQMLSRFSIWVLSKFSGLRVCFFKKWFSKFNFNYLREAPNKAFKSDSQRLVISV